MQGREGLGKRIYKARRLDRLRSSVRRSLPFLRWLFTLTTVLWSLLRTTPTLLDDHDPLMTLQTMPVMSVRSLVLASVFAPFLGTVETSAWAKPFSSSSLAQKRTSVALARSSSLSELDPSFAVSVVLGGTTYVNKVCLLSLSIYGRSERRKEASVVGSL